MSDDDGLPDADDGTGHLPNGRYHDHKAYPCEDPDHDQDRPHCGATMCGDPIVVRKEPKPERFPEYDGMTTRSLLSEMLGGVPLKGMDKVESGIIEKLLENFQVIPIRAVERKKREEYERIAALLNEWELSERSISEFSRGLHLLQRLARGVTLEQYGSPEPRVNLYNEDGSPRSLEDIQIEAAILRGDLPSDPRT